MSATDTNAPQRPAPYFVPTRSPAQQDDAINLLDVLRFLLTYKWIIAGITLLSMALSAAIAFNMTPIYRAEVLMALANEEQTKGGLSALAGQFGGLASLAGVDLGGGSGTKNEAIATLKSRAFTEKFIKDENLLPVLFEEKWDNENHRWLESDQATVPSMWSAYELFNGIRSIAEDTKTGLITLRIEWKDPVLAARWANLLVYRVNELLRAGAIDQAQRSIDYLKRELAKTSVVELQQGIYRLIEGQVNRIMLANVRDDYTFRLVDPAVVPMEKVWPKRKLIVVIGGISGFVLGLTLAFLSSLFGVLESTHTNGTNLIKRHSATNS